MAAKGGKLSQRSRYGDIFRPISGRTKIVWNLTRASTRALKKRARGLRAVVTVHHLVQRRYVVDADGKKQIDGSYAAHASKLPILPANNEAHP